MKRSVSSSRVRTPRSAAFLLFIFFVLMSGLTAQEAPSTVNVQVDASRTEGVLKPIWSFAGYDEPNPTPNGKKLLGELQGESPSRCISGRTIYSPAGTVRIL